MPNHVLNKVIFDCSDERLDQILRYIQDDKVGMGTIDFNKLIKMPESLKIESGSLTNNSINLYLTYINPEAKQYGKDENKISSKELNSLIKKLQRHVGVDCNLDIEQINNMQQFNIDGDLLKLGKNAVENVVNYDAVDWYEWSIKNWGTKWNAYNIEPLENGINFQTAWSAPHPIIHEISRKFPDVSIEHMWADEDLGSNCGRLKYRGGEVVEEYLPDYGKESIEYALSVWNDEAASFGLSLNATGKDYISYDYDDYELVDFRGNICMFTDQRLTMDEIPIGLYCYGLRGSDSDPNDFISLEKSVIVNNAGTLITYEPIDFGENDFIDLKGEDEINFLGLKATLKEYMNHDYDTEAGITFE